MRRYLTKPNKNRRTITAIKTQMYSGVIKTQVQFVSGAFRSRQYGY